MNQSFCGVRRLIGNSKVFLGCTLHPTWGQAAATPRDITGLENGWCWMQSIKRAAIGRFLFDRIVPNMKCGGGDMMVWDVHPLLP